MHEQNSIAVLHFRSMSPCLIPDLNVVKDGMADIPQSLYEAMRRSCNEKRVALVLDDIYIPPSFC
jgi:hypothetical protein